MNMTMNIDHHQMHHIYDLGAPIDMKQMSLNHMNTGTGAMMNNKMRRRTKPYSILALLRSRTNFFASKSRRNNHQVALVHKMPTQMQNHEHDSLSEVLRDGIPYTLHISRDLRNEAKHQEEEKECGDDDNDNCSMFGDDTTAWNDWRLSKESSRSEFLDNPDMYTYGDDRGEGRDENDCCDDDVSTLTPMSYFTSQLSFTTEGKSGIMLSHDDHDDEIRHQASSGSGSDDQTHARSVAISVYSCGSQKYVELKRKKRELEKKIEESLHRSNSNVTSKTKSCSTTRCSTTLPRPLSSSSKTRATSKGKRTRSTHSHLLVEMM